MYDFQDIAYPFGESRESVPFYLLQLVGIRTDMSFEDPMAHVNSHRHGFTLLATAMCAVGLFGMAGLAIDIGRMYITKNEAQGYADAAALAAAQQLDGTASGLTNADSAVSAS